MEYRKTKKEDLNKIAIYMRELLALHSEMDSFYKIPDETELLEILTKELEDRNRILISAIKDNELIGFIKGLIRKSPPDRTEDYAILHDIYIDPEYRNHGIGEQLFLKFKEETKGIRLELTVDIHNKSAIKFWEKMGFKTFMFKMFS